MAITSKTKKAVYLDCFSGISGDMMLGAIVDAGLPLEVLEERLRLLPIDGYRLSMNKVRRGGLSATKVDVIPIGHHNRAVYLSDIVKIIEDSGLEDEIKGQALGVFNAIFNAEAKVHGESPETVHLHELGGIDCMVDVVGTLIGLKHLGIETVYASPINLGSGTIKTSHGLLPVPAPATAELLRGFKTYLSHVSMELTTPTGAALLCSMAKQTDTVPMSIEKIGYGAGNIELPQQPNVLRLIVFNPVQSDIEETLFVVETNIDDMNPQFYEPVMSMLLKAGARDAFIENIIMKKGRPAVKLTALCDSHILQEVCNLIFTHTTSIGIRYYPVKRQVLERETVTLNGSKGVVRVKIAIHNGKVINQSPEFEDLLIMSEKEGISLKELHAHVLYELRETAKRRVRG